MSLLAVEGVSRSFGGLKALSDVSFEVPEGTVFGVIGPNGAGKTTLFNILSGALSPSEGRILFAGDDITKLSRHRRCRAGIGRTYQVVQPFKGMSVIENVMIGAFTRTRSAPDARAVAERELQRTGLLGRADEDPESLPVVLRKRLEVARALATDPKLLLLDEVMAGLNPVEIREMLELVEDVRESGVSVVVIEHLMAAINRLCDNVLVLDHGEQLAIGTPAEVMKDPKVVDAYLGEGF